MGCPGGHSLSIYARFSGKKRTSLYIFREKGDHYYIHIKHGTTISFSHYNLFNRRLVSSVGRAPVCRAGGRGFKLPDQHSGSLNN